MVDLISHLIMRHLLRTVSTIATRQAWKSIFSLGTRGLYFTSYNAYTSGIALVPGRFFFNRTKLKNTRLHGNEATSGSAIDTTTNKLMSLNRNNGYTKLADF